MSFSQPSQFPQEGGMALFKNKKLADEAQG